MLGAPTFIDKLGRFPNDTFDSRVAELTDGFAATRAKRGKERYLRIVDLAARAKALFAADPDSSNGQTDEGRELLFAIEDEIRDARRRRVAARLPDEEGRVTGD